MLYHLLPVVFWLLAIGGCAIPVFLYFFHWIDFDGEVNPHYFWGFLVAAIVLLCIHIIGRILRQQSSVEQCFQVAVLLGIASYWLPTVIFLIIPAILYLYIRHLFDFRSFMALLLGFALVAIWAAIFIYAGWIANPWSDFFAPDNAWGWIPTGAAIVALLASSIARQTLRVR